MKYLIYPNIKKDLNLAVTKKYVSYLLSHGNEIYINSELECYFDDDRIAFVSLGECIQKADLALVIGGDGTILRASREIYGHNIPIIGINLGKVGYMSELEIDEIELLSGIATANSLNDIHSITALDERMMLKYDLIRGDSIIASGIALNEAVISKCDVNRMIDIDLMHDNGLIAKYQCDGIIVSTPTGSTAYSMSAGGAIIDPKLECINVIPFCPYLCINSSPIIFSKDSNIEMIFRSPRETKAYLGLDGCESVELCDGDRIKITCAEHTTKLLRIKNIDFYKLLSTKLTNRMLELTDR